MVDAPHRRRSCRRLRRGGHDPEKVYAAYKPAVETQGAPTVILAKTDQGLRPGRGGRGQERHAPAEEAQRGGAARVPRPLRHPGLRRGRDRRRRSTGRPRTAPRSSTCASAARRSAAACPARARRRDAAGAARATVFDEFLAGSGDREVSTTMAFVRMLRRCCGNRSSGRTSCRSSPTRRAPSAWSRCSASSASTRTSGQLYEPVDAEQLLYYREAKDGQILEEGITEAGSMSLVHRRRHRATPRTACR